MLELLLPQRCLACGRSGAVVCEACLDALPRLTPPLCERCGAPTAWPVRRCAECAGRRLGFASARAAVAYDERVRRIVAGWKEHGLRRLACEAALLVAEMVPRPDVDALTFVPPDRDRVLKRGHHPPARLARELGALWSLPVRELVVRGAFAARPSPRAVCLVDDVYTSGATVSAAASALRKAGAKEVRVVTVARTPRLGRSPLSRSARSAR